MLGDLRDATIKIRRPTRDMLKRIGRKDEDYDALLWRLMREAGYLDEEGNLIKRA